MTMTYRELLIWCEDKLNNAGIKEYKSDAYILFEHALGISKTMFFVKSNDKVDEESSSVLKLKGNVEKRCERIPVQYITNSQEFMGLEFYVDENVLIPRFDTEVLVEEVLKYIKGFEGLPDVLDMCTGSGCIAISLAKLGNTGKVTASDIHEGSIEVAKRNAKSNEVEINFVKSDLFDLLEGTSFDIIVSNPPYIRTEVLETLMTEVIDHEPVRALDGTEDGLMFYRKITKAAVKHLNRPGYLAYEIGHDQGDDVAEIMKSNGFVDVKVIKDLAGLERVVTGFITK